MSSLSVIQNGIGWHLLSDAVLCFEGSDLIKVLQSTWTNDLEDLTPESGMIACQLTPKGRLIAILECFLSNGQLWAKTSRVEVEGLLDAMKIPLMFSETCVQNLSSRYQWLLLIGKKLPEFIEANTGQPFVLKCSKRDWSWKEKKIPFLQTTRFIEPAVFFLLENEETAEFIAHLSAEYSLNGIMPLTEEAYETLTIESQIPKFGIDVNEHTLPPEANLEEALSYTKGCYIGQETISRIKHYGKVQKKLIQVQLDSDPSLESPTPLFSQDKEVGVLTRTAYSDRFEKWIGLATIRREVLESIAPLHLKTPEGKTVFVHPF